MNCSKSADLFSFLSRSPMCGRCTRRDAGTSSRLETASVSSMRTSWVKEGRLTHFPSSWKRLNLNTRWTFSAAIVLKKKKKIHSFILKWCNCNKITQRKRTDDWTFLVRTSNSSSLATMPLLCKSLFWFWFTLPFHLLNPNLLHNLLCGDIWYMWRVTAWQLNVWICTTSRLRPGL